MTICEPVCESGQSLNENGGNEVTRLIINGGKPLRGEIAANGAKNAALPIMAACILAPGKVKLNRIPDISDVRIMGEILRQMGAEVCFDGKGSVVIDTTNLSETKAPYRLVKKLNASFDITGALLGRHGDASVPLPGGCVIGTRAIDMHLEGFKSLGCVIGQEPGGFVSVKANKLSGGRYHFAKTSVGATKNVMMAAVLAKGKTILENVAREPEVVDLADFLNACGANITGQGTTKLEIHGVKELHADFEYSIIPDRIETGTYLTAAAITGGDITVSGTNPEFLKTFLRKIGKAGQKVTTGNDFIRVEGMKPILPVGAIITEPHPGFPTDLQPQTLTLLSLSNGTSYVREKIFDMRFNYINELRRMGANVEIEGGTAVVRGVSRLLSAPVDAPDIRAGSALVLAALAAEGVSEVSGLCYIDRGYEKIEDRFASVGADIRRVP
ncbi:MAG: UDP-N-acetylglucosamine 1-carboxyvinyltransferase [Firmicutes bacterium]|nr:UDP-N-acetylglucosamine 1-carboxyvinyltransferase [Bacillota bacterium]